MSHETFSAMDIYAGTVILWHSTPSERDARTCLDRETQAVCPSGKILNKNGT